MDTGTTEVPRGGVLNPQPDPSEGHKQPDNMLTLVKASSILGSPAPAPAAALALATFSMACAPNLGKPGKIQDCRSRQVQLLGPPLLCVLLLLLASKQLFTDQIHDYSPQMSMAMLLSRNGKHKAEQGPLGICRVGTLRPTIYTQDCNVPPACLGRVPSRDFCFL